MKKLSALRFHELAEKAREEDKHLEALKLIEEAIIRYQQEKNYQGLSQALQSRFLIYKHLFFLTKDKVFALMGQKDGEVSLFIAEKYKLSKSIGSCYFRLGEAAMLFKNYSRAAKQYQMALDHYHGSNTEKGDYYYHLGEALYRSGKKKKGKEKMLQGLDKIQNYANEVNPFLAHVWESGCHLKLAELLKDEQPEEAIKHLNQAKKIANSDEKLIIRRRQIEKLAQDLHPRIRNSNNTPIFRLF